MKTTILSVLVAFAAILLGAPMAAAEENLQLQLQIELAARDLYSATPQAYQYTAHRAIRDYAALPFLVKQPYLLELAYNDDEIGGLSDETWTAVLNYERTMDGWSWGVQPVEQYTDRAPFGSLWYEGVNGYAYYKVDEFSRVGGYLNLNYAWSDVVGIDDELSWGLGAFASYEFNLSDAACITPAAVFSHYSAGQTGFEDSNIISVGARFDYDVSANVTLLGRLFYNTDTSNDAVDDSFVDWEAGFNYRIDESWDISGAIGTTESFSDFSRTTYKVSVGFTF